MKSNNTQYKTRQKDNSCAVILAIFACKLREAIMSLLTERACSSQTLTEQSRCRERAACALISHRYQRSQRHCERLAKVED